VFYISIQEGLELCLGG